MSSPRNRLLFVLDRPIERRSLLISGACAIGAFGIGCGASGAMPLDDTGSSTSPDAGTVTPADAGSDLPDSGPLGQDIGSAPDSGPSCGRTLLGTVSDFAPGRWVLITQRRVIVGHDAGGLFAFSAICTHRGCEVDAPDATGSTFCPCHGSMFDGNGAVVQGPARAPLQHFAVTICNGSDVYYDITKPVAASVRTPVP